MDTRTDRLNMEVKDALGVVVHIYLEGSHNFEDRSVQVKDYLMIDDLWDVVEETNKPPLQEDDGTIFHAWSKKNSIALQVIKNSFELDTLFEI